MENRWSAAAATALVLSFGGVACSDDTGHVPPPTVESTVTTGIEPGTGVSALPDSLTNKEGKVFSTDAQQLLKDAFGSFEEPGALLNLTNDHFGKLVDAVTSSELTPDDSIEGPGLMSRDDYTDYFSKINTFKVPYTHYIVQDLNNDPDGHDRLVQIVEVEADENAREIYSYRASLQFGPYGNGTGKSHVVASVAIPPVLRGNVRNAENALGRNVPKGGWTDWTTPLNTPTDFLRTNGDVNGPEGGFYQEVRVHVTERTGMISTAAVLS